MSIETESNVVIYPAPKPQFKRLARAPKIQREYHRDVVVLAQRGTINISSVRVSRTQTMTKYNSKIRDWESKTIALPLEKNDNEDPTQRRYESLAYSITRSGFPIMITQDRVYAEKFFSEIDQPKIF